MAKSETSKALITVEDLDHAYLGEIWRLSPELRSEFGTYAIFLAYCRAERDGSAPAAAAGAMSGPDPSGLVNLQPVIAHIKRS